MIRPLAMFAVLAIGLSPALAQEAVLTQPAPEDIVVNPSAPTAQPPKRANMLTGIYATKAVIELCALTIDPKVLAAIDSDTTNLQTSMGIDAATGTTAYERVKADVEKTKPDCAEGSADRASVDAVTGLYAQKAATATVPPAAAAAATPAPVGTEAPAAPKP